MLIQGIGDNSLAYQCFKMAITNDNNHAEAYNNLGVLEWRNNRKEQVNTNIKITTYFLMCM